jgi:ABC-type uncharacterized transport system involved in gliding motility auxiliary subunit
MAGKNKKPYARYAFIGLLLAMVACVATGLLGTAKGMLAIKMFTLDDDKLNIVNVALSTSVALLIIGLAAYALMSPDTVRRLFSGRQARYGSNSLVMIVAFLGILFAANYLVYQNPGFLGSPWDWTEDQSNTLAPETLQTLAALPQKVKATAFYTGNLSPADAEELLAKFKSNSPDKFDYEFVDPNRDPLAAREAGITGDGKVLLAMGETKEVAAYASEDELTKALIRLISPEKRAVYFLEGHGEISLEMGGELSYGTVKTTLESKNYVVNTLNLLTTKDIPEDASVIVIAGPKKPVSKEEVDRLKAYVDGGGSLFIMEDPVPLTEFGSQADPLNEYLKKDWGIELNNDVVIDYVNTQNPLAAVSSNVGMHPITQNLSMDYIVVLPQARSLAITGEKESVTQTALLLTTEQSWGETELTSNQAAQFDEGKDIPGPLTLAIAADNSVTKGRVVVFGNSVFASDNGGFEAYGNGNIFVNSADWAAEQEDLINLTVRERKTRVFTPPANIWLIVIMVFAIVALPGLIMLTGIFSWVARRRKG